MPSYRIACTIYCTVSTVLIIFEKVDHSSKGYKTPLTLPQLNSTFNWNFEWTMLDWQFQKAPWSTSFRISTAEHLHPLDIAERLYRTVVFFSFFASRSLNHVESASEKGTLGMQQSCEATSLKLYLLNVVKARADRGSEAGAPGGLRTIRQWQNWINRYAWT